MIITEAELDTLLEDPEIMAFALVGRPAKPDDDLRHEIEGKERKINIADIYLFRRPEDGLTTLSLHKDQLALPVGVRCTPRTSAKPILSTERGNLINTVVPGGFEESS